MDAQTIIARRVARELHAGDLVNLGIGIPTLVANYVPPFLLDPFKHLLGLALDHDIEWHEDRRFQCLCKRLDVLFGTIVEIGDGEIGSKGTKRLGASPCDRRVVGDVPMTRPLLPCRATWYPECGKHNTLARLGLGDGCVHQQRQCVLAIISSSSVGMT